MTAIENIVIAIEKGIRQIYSNRTADVPLHAPSFHGNERKYVRDCIDTGWVSSIGKYVEKFEEMVAQFTGAAHAIATVNGTSALHIALLLSNVDPDDEVLCPAFSFVATANSIVYCGAHPVFMDCDPDTLGMDPEKVGAFLEQRCIKKKDGFTYNRSSGRKVKACMPMHAYGYPVNMNPLEGICKANRITIIEDAAEALGSYYKGKHCGTMGLLGVVSFNGNKIITSGGGGMILTDESDLARKAKHLTTTAKVGHPWEYVHDQVGFNYRMPNINAALGCAQLEALPGFLAQKRKQAESLRACLKGSEEIKVLQPETDEVNNWFNLIEIDPDCRDDVLKSLNETGIQARAAWTPLCDMPPYEKYERFEIATARDLFRSIICLPNGLRK